MARRCGVDESHRYKRSQAGQATREFQLLWEAKNRRRIRLINKKYAEGLDARETDELKTLKRAFAAYMETVAPRDGGVLDEQYARLEKLKLKLKKAKAERSDHG